VYLSVTRTGQCVLSAGSAGQRRAAPGSAPRPAPTGQCTALE
jgi:hypothetical protein